MKAVLFSSEKLEIRKSIIHGWGVFTKQDIKSGELLQECHGLFIGADRYKEYQNNPEIACNAFRVANDLCMIPYGFGAIYNSNLNANIATIFDTKNMIMCFYAIKDIRSGSELFLNYEAERMALESNGIFLL